MPSFSTLMRLMWAVERMRLLSKSCRKPLFIANATISEATPAATPAIEITVITPTTAWRRLARKYREAMKSSNRTLLVFVFRNLRRVEEGEISHYELITFIQMLQINRAQLVFV